MADGASDTENREGAGESAYDLVVVGGTPGGVAAAVRGAREGLAVALVAYNARLGGMMASGLNHTDTTVGTARAPLHDETFERVVDHYRERYGPGSSQVERCDDGLAAEPSVMERVFEEMVADAGVAVRRGYHPETVERDGASVESVHFTPIPVGRAGATDGHDGPGVAAFAESDGETDGSPTPFRLEADAFVDATYEGDLYAAAGAEYRLGRERRDAFGEQYAGRIFSEKGTRLMPGSTGEGDDVVQAYDYRLCLTNDPDRRRPVPRPEDYDREEFRPVIEAPPEAEADDADSWWDEARDSARYPCHVKSELARMTPAEAEELGLELLMLRGPLPNDKRDLNTGDLPGESHEYPEGDWETRAEIARRHRDHVLGLLYFLQHDDAVPTSIRERFGEWGLPTDEFTDNEGFPFQLYVREARRLAGRATFTENDARLTEGLERPPVHTDAVAITDYPLDSHDCRPVRRPGSLAEGHFFLNELTAPGQLSYDCLLPRSVDNLLVPVALSASHVGYGGVRLEPTWLQVGEAAGYAAALAADADVPPADLDADRLQRRLAADGARLSYFTDLPVDESPPAVQYLATKGFFDDFEARLEEPLDPETAATWAETTVLVAREQRAVDARSSGEPFDATERARALPGTGGTDLVGDEDGETAGVTCKSFCEELVAAFEAETGTDPAVPDVDAVLADLGFDADRELTRADGCRIAYGVLRADGEDR